MCGIVGYVGGQDAVPIILAGLHRLEYRGYDSAGIAVVTRGGLKLHKAAGTIAQLESHLPKRLHGGVGIGHTRWATHGRPTEENAHPHLDCTGKIVVVHNGIIENYLDLKQEL
jgi:glutamine---fructose-6-phosphate transaminase (isomerizing)